jgi:hypothetical protein
VDQVRAGVSASAGGVGAGGVEKATNNYAMFSAPIGQQNLADVHRSQELRRRTGVGAEDSSGSAYVTNFENGMTNMNGHINGNMSMNMNMKASMRDYNGKPYNNNSNSNNSSSSSSSSGDRYGRGYSTQNQHQLQLQQQQQRPSRDMRAHLQGAEKVEKTIAQVITCNTLIQLNDNYFQILLSYIFMFFYKQFYYVLYDFVIIIFCFFV